MNMLKDAISSLFTSLCMSLNAPRRLLASKLFCEWREDEGTGEHEGSSTVPLIELAMVQANYVGDVPPFIMPQVYMYFESQTKMGKFGPTNLLTVKEEHFMAQIVSDLSVLSNVSIVCFS